MEQMNGSFVLQLGREQLCLGGLNRLHMCVDHWDVNRHSNGHWEMHMVLEGACRVEVEDRQYTLTEGQGILIAPGHYHLARAEAGSFLRLCVCFVTKTPGISAQLSSRCHGSVFLEADARRTALGRQLMQEQTLSRPFRQTQTTALLTQLMVDLLRFLDISENPENSQKRDFHRTLVIVDDYFETHFADAAGEEVLAQRLHVSRRQLVRILQEHYGMSFREKLVHTRMDYAAWLLRTTDQSVSSIAQSVGYTSEAAFFKLFRRQFSMTPLAYRNRKQNV